MKLLNLWPEQRSKTAPRQQLLREWVLAMLLVLLVLLASFVVQNSRVAESRKTLVVVQTELAALKQSRVLELTGAPELARALRERLAGQLDWMGDLPRWLGAERVFWVSAQFDESGLWLEGLAPDAEAIERVLGAVREILTGASVGVSELNHVNVGGQALWRFRLKLDAASLAARVNSLTVGAARVSDAKGAVHVVVPKAAAQGEHDAPR